MSIRLYVGNLPKELERQELQAVFAAEGDAVTAKVITDRKTGKCRGFGFVTVATDEQADQIIEKYNGFLFKESPLKIEKALPRSKGKSDKGDEDQPQQQGGGVGQPQPQQQRSAPVPSTGGGKSNRRREKDKGRRPAGTTSYSADSGSVQPDPRWASALEELKQRLQAAQTNS